MPSTEDMEMKDKWLSFFVKSWVGQVVKYTEAIRARISPEDAAGAPGLAHSRPSGKCFG